MFLKKSGTGTYFTMVNNVSISRKKLIFIILIITESSKLSSIAKMSKAMLPKPCLKLFKVRKYIFVKSTLLYLFTFFFVKSTIICQKNFREINYVFFQHLLVMKIWSKLADISWANLAIWLLEMLDLLLWYNSDSSIPNIIYVRKVTFFREINFCLKISWNQSISRIFQV